MSEAIKFLFLAQSHEKIFLKLPKGVEPFILS
jgi:hypothetical protein